METYRGKWSTLNPAAAEKAEEDWRTFGGQTEQ